MPKRRTQIIAHHLVWTGYGWWLPNDPRGSGSREVRCDVLRDLGELHHGRKPSQPPGRVVRQFYEEARSRLAHPLFEFDECSIRTAGEAIGAAIESLGYTCWAAAVMPDHVHLAIRRHRDRAEEMIERIQSESAKRIVEEFDLGTGHPVWTLRGYKVFLRTPDDVRRTVRYVERNPLEIAWEPQSWEFVVEYDGWPLSGKQ